MTSSDKPVESMPMEEKRFDRPLSDFAVATPGVLGGKLRFKDDRISIAMFFGYLCTGKGVKDFMQDYPGSITMDQAEGVIMLAFEALLRENGFDADIHRQMF
jgi:uncharacterized protein (DUF433 family)